MPINCWSNDAIDQVQRHSRYVEAADRIEQLENLLSDCQQTIAELRDGEDCDHSVGICWCGVDKLQEGIQEALKGKL